MDWNFINARERDKRENQSTELDFSKYEIKKPKKVNPVYDMRKEIAVLVGKPVLQICSQTKGFTEDQLKGMLVDAENDAKKFKINVGARLWNLIKEVRLKNKQNGKG
jgi:hypothetical protein